MSKNSVQIQIAKQLPITLNSKISIDDHSVVINEAVMCGGVTTIRGYLDKEPQTNNLATQTQEEKEALDSIKPVHLRDYQKGVEQEGEWKNGDECEIDMTEGVRRYIFGCECPNNQNTCIVFTKDGSGHMVMSIERLKKPEAPEEKEKRERLEAAYDLYCESLISEDEEAESFIEFKSYRNRMRQWLRIVDKTNYRKEK